MKKQYPFLPEQISLEEWEETPGSVKQWVESLLAGAALSESESHLIQFLDATPIGISVHDATGQIIYINQVGRELLGTERSSDLNAEMIPESFQVYRSTSQTPYPIDELPSTRALNGEVAWADDIEIRRPDRTVPLEVKATPIFDEQADQLKVAYAIAAFQDISERKRRQMEQHILENTLLKSEHRYRQVIQAQTDLILRSLPDTTITFANNSLCLALGQPLESVIGMQWNSFILPSEEFDKINGKIADLTPEKPIFENVNQDYRANGQIGWTQWINLGIFDDRGTLIEIQSVGRDITVLQEKIQREQALHRVFQAIRNSLDLETIFATAATETARLLQNLDCFVVQYLSQEKLWRHVSECRHNSADPTTIGLEISDGGNPFATRLKQLQIVQVEDTSNLNDVINQEVAQLIPGAWLLIPLVVEGRLWGSFTIIASHRSFAWSEAEVELAQSVAGQLEIAIQQANLYQQVQQELEERRRIEAALRQSEDRFRHMADNVPGVIYGYRLYPDGSDQYTYLSSGFREMYELEPEGALQDPDIVWNTVHPDDLESLKNSVIHSHQTLQTWQHQYRAITASGQLKWVQGISRPTQQPDGSIIWDGLIIDISELKQAEADLRESEVRYRLLAENSNDLVCLLDKDGHYLYVSPSCETLLGYRSDEMVGQDASVFIHSDDYDRVHREAYASAIESIADSKTIPITYRIRQKSGSYIWFETLTKAIVDDSGRLIQLQTTSRDVTERVQVQNQLEHDALHDALTGLPNRNLLMERLKLAINRIQDLEDYQFAVLFLDLDRFKVINDSLGHLAGDQLLIAIAERLQNALRVIDLVTRLGGDEFVILLEQTKDIQEAVRATERVFAALQPPLLIEGREVYTTASVGIVLGTRNYTQADHLLRDADTAMYRAKSQGKARYEVFDAEMHTQALNRLHLENSLRRAIDGEEFVLHYQPIVALTTGELKAFEALIRWQHPTQGMIAPGEFIPVAEETGLITLLDYWALQTACRQLAEWQASFPALSDLKISVNLSAQDLQRADLLAVIDRILTQTHLESRCLILEITESMLIEDVEFTIALLHQLKERGIQFSIDDFGTGYSSLSYLHRLPVDSLKVDRSFVHQIQPSSQSHQIVETIVALGQQLELDTIAEGIETQQQLERLQQLGYQFGQGYLFSKPLSQQATEAFLRDRGLARRD